MVKRKEKMVVDSRWHNKPLFRPMGEAPIVFYLTKKLSAVNNKSIIRSRVPIVMSLLTTSHHKHLQVIISTYSSCLLPKYAKLAGCGDPRQTLIPINVKFGSGLWTYLSLPQIYTVPKYMKTALDLH